MLSLSKKVEKAVRSEGEAAYPDECCGFLLGTLDAAGFRTGEDILPAANAWTTSEKRRRFRITPEDFLRAEQEAGAKDLCVVGFYHSHPDHPSRPSEYDREQALPCYSYVIVAVSGGRAVSLTSWELSPDRSGFVQEL
ncbi:MAG: M67 family metallopeptidase [Desulfovibrio sp.]|jgi:proteasome lid subunit RPN8/RPN11|nr:M67 family metallopeptidase [Desulfovibrio sp.]